MIKKLKKELRHHLMFLDYYRNNIYNQMKTQYDFHNKRILDLGCDDGFYESKLKEKCSEIIAIDINDLALKVDRQKIKSKKIHFINENIYHIKVEKYGKFDVILFMNMLFLIKFDDIFLKKISNLLSRKGLFIIHFPNKDGNHYYQFNKKNKGDKISKIINEFSVEEVIKLMKKNGFSLKFKSSLFHSLIKGLPLYLSYLNKLKHRGGKKNISHYLLIFENNDKA